MAFFNICEEVVLIRSEIIKNLIVPYRRHNRRRTQKLIQQGPLVWALKTTVNEDGLVFFVFSFFKKLLYIIFYLLKDF